jgi:glycosyltransferase involved in cell wall biosynthesis
MKILHIAPTPFYVDRGCHIRIKGIVDSLGKKGLKNIVCTYHHGRDVSDIDIRRIRRIRGYNKLEAGPSIYKYFADVLLFLLCCQTIVKEKPDIIHGHLHEGGLIGWMAKNVIFWKKVPLILDLQGSLVGELSSHGYFKNSKILYKIFYWAEYLISRMPNYFICSGKNSYDFLINEFNVPKEKIITVHDGIDINIFCNESAEGIKGEIDIPKKKKVIIYTGSLLPAKGVGILHECILELAKKRNDVHFLIVGFPQEKTVEFVKKYGLMDRCSIVGAVPINSLPGYLSMGDVAVDPKLNTSGEASGKILNYMGAGLPVVCFENNNNRYLLKEYGYFASPGSTKELAGKIESVLDDLPNAKKRGFLGKELVMNNHTWDKLTDSIVFLYTSAIDSREVL